MQPRGWLSKLWTRIRDAVIQDGPPFLDDCEFCRALNCGGDHWSTCAVARAPAPPQGPPPLAIGPHRRLAEN